MPKEGACYTSLVLHLSILILPKLFLLLLPCTWSLVYQWHHETVDVLAFLLHELIACRNFKVSQALLISPLHYVFRNSYPHLQFVPTLSQCFNLFLLLLLILFPTTGCVSSQMHLLYMNNFAAVDFALET